jgi:predicted PurR-regulated permease PerM
MFTTIFILGLILLFFLTETKKGDELFKGFLDLIITEKTAETIGTFFECVWAVIRVVFMVACIWGLTAIILAGIDGAYN